MKPERGVCIGHVAAAGDPLGKRQPGRGPRPRHEAAPPSASSDQMRGSHATQGPCAVVPRPAGQGAASRALDLPSPTPSRSGAHYGCPESRHVACIEPAGTCWPLLSPDPPSRPHSLSQVCVKSLTFPMYMYLFSFHSPFVAPSFMLPRTIFPNFVSF